MLLQYDTRRTTSKGPVNAASSRGQITWKRTNDFTSCPTVILLRETQINHPTNAINNTR